MHHLAYLQIDFRGHQPPGIYGTLVFTFGKPDTRAMVAAFAAGRCPGPILADYLEEHEDVAALEHLLAALRVG